MQRFDIEKDLGETTDLAAEKPDLIAKAKALFESARTDSPGWPIKDAVLGKGQ